MKKELTQPKTKQLKLFYFIQHTCTNQSWRATVEVHCDSYKTYLHIKGAERNANIMEKQGRY